MADYEFGGADDIDRAISYLVSLDERQRNALAVIEIDEAIDELQVEFEKASRDPEYRPDDDFIVRLTDYLAAADDSENPHLA